MDHPLPPAGGRSGGRKLSPLQYALYLLRNRSRSKKEIATKLRDREYSDEDIAAATKDLERIGFLDDKKYATNYAQDKVRLYRRGRHRIALELIQKGVPKEIINEAVAAVESEQELEAARSLLASKERQWRDLTERKRFEKSVHLLQRRGFPGSIIRQLLKR